MARIGIYEVTPLTADEELNPYVFIESLAVNNNKITIGGGLTIDNLRETLTIIDEVRRGVALKVAVSEGS